MRKVLLGAVLVVVGIAVFSLPASAAIHPIVCSRGLEPAGLADNPARSAEVADPPGITPDGDTPFGPHEDPLMAADHNPTAQFAPLVQIFFNADENAGHAVKGEGDCHND